MQNPSTISLPRAEEAVLKLCVKRPRVELRDVVKALHVPVQQAGRLLESLQVTGFIQSLIMSEEGQEQFYVCPKGRKYAHTHHLN